MKKANADNGTVTYNASLPATLGRFFDKKSYELTDHLGNVRVSISDLPKGYDNNSDGKADYYFAGLSSFTDYGPFGEPLPGRKFVSTNYPYGFNGKEKDDEGMGGGGSTYDYGFRIYNPNIGRFLSVDPLFQTYPFYTPYQFASNTPILAVDVDGLESNILLNNIEWAGAIGMEYIVGPTINTLKAGANLASTYGTGIYNAATVYIPQQFGAKGGTAANVHTTQGTVTFGSPQHIQINNQSAATVTTDALVGQTTGGVFKLATPLAKPLLQKVTTLTLESNILASGLPIVFKSKPLNVAFGKTKAGLAGFANKIGAVYYETWNNYFNLSGVGSSFSSKFYKVTDEIISGGGKIHFSLKGVDTKKAMQGGLGTSSEAYANEVLTEWELNQVLSDKKLFENTIFYDEQGVQKTASELGLKLLEN